MAVQWLKLGIEVAGTAIVAIGIGLALYLLARALWKRQANDFHDIRLLLARYLILALEFQLAADILSTAIAPGWDQIAKLGAIAVIRTALNYFLMLEMREEEANEANLHKNGKAAKKDPSRA